MVLLAPELEAALVAASAVDPHPAEVIAVGLVDAAAGLDHGRPAVGVGHIALAAGRTAVVLDPFITQNQKFDQNLQPYMNLEEYTTI